MSETRTITLGGATFAVPPLPLRINRIAYPICRRLTAAKLIDRAVAIKGALDCTAEEMGDLADLAYLAASAADGSLTREVFDDMPVTPPELLDAFFATRYQTGAWVEAEPSADADIEPGESAGA